MQIDWKQLGSRVLGAVLGGFFAGVAAKAGGASWAAAGAAAGTAAAGMVGYAAHSTVTTPTDSKDR